MESNEQPMNPAQRFWDKHSFLIFISSSVFIATIIVSISMAIYNGSGAAQLDLSRPGYVNVRSQAIDNNGDFQTYSGNGKLNLQAIREFKSMYVRQADKIVTVDAFGGDPLSADSLDLNLPDAGAN